MKWADEIVLSFCASLEEKIPDDQEVKSEDALIFSKEQIKLAMKVVLASLIEFELRTGLPQAVVISEALNCACHLYDFAPVQIAERINSCVNKEINAEFTSYIGGAVTSGMEFRSELNQMVGAIARLDFYGPTFRQQVDTLVGARTTSPMEPGFKSTFSSNDGR